MNTTGIRPCAAQPFYWEYHGQPVLLLGGSDQDNLFQWAAEPGKLDAHLDMLVACGGNYLRNTMSSRYYHKYITGRDPMFLWNVYPYGFKKLADGRYDLTQWDDRYWTMLDTFLRETHRRGIIVQTEIWDAWNQDAQAGWPVDPWNPDNNTNYTYENTCCRRQFPFLRNPFFEAVPALRNDRVLLEHQNRYIGKIVDTCLAYDHVLFQIDNESPLPLEVSDYWAGFIRDRAAGQGRTAYVCDSRRFHVPSVPYEEFKDWANPEIRHPIENPALFGFCDLSQNGGNWGQYHYDNLVWYRSRVAEHGARPINHTKIYRFNWRTGAAKFGAGPEPTDAEAGAKFWRAIFGGAASARFHRQYPGGLALTPLGQTHIRSARMLADRLAIFDMAPAPDLLSDREEDEAYCLAEPGRQYALFFTEAGDRRVSLDLRASRGPLTAQWLDVAKSTWVAGAPVDGGGTATLAAPGAGHWAVALQRTDEEKAAGGPRETNRSKNAGRNKR